MMPDLLEAVQKPNEAVFPGVARLAAGVSITVAQEQYDNLAARLDDELRRPGERIGPRVRLEPLRSGMFWYSYRYLWMLAAAAALVGLLACANFSSLLLARGRSREQQVALRSALGASRGRLLVTELVQSLTVCAMAGALAIAVVSLATDGLRALAHPSFAALVLDGIDHRLIATTAIAALLSCVLAGLWPAWRATRTGLVGVLHRTAGAPARVRRNRAGQVVLGIEAALGVVLVFGAAVTTRSFAGLVMTDLGLETERLHVVRIVPTGNRRGGDDASERARYLGVLETLRRRPGIVAAGGVDSMPAQGAAPWSGAEWEPGVRAGVWQITDGLLAALGARIVAGRDVTSDEVLRARPVALVTVAMARRLWPNDPPERALGRHLTPNRDSQPGSFSHAPREIIGVVADMRSRPDSAPEPMVFAPIGVPGFFQLQFAVRTSTDAAPDEELLRRELAGPFGVTGVSINPAGDRIASSLREPRARAILFGSFGVVGLVLASIGLFAVASFHVAQRRYELGVRSALGASAGSIRRLVIADVVRPVVFGTFAGLVAAYWAGEFVQSLLHQVDARDPWTLAVVVATLIATAVLASWPPARRAGRIDPAVVLREG
jgi:predicted permease